MEYDGKYSKNNKNNIHSQNRINPSNEMYNETSNSSYGRGIETMKYDNKSDYPSKLTNVNRIGNVVGGGCSQSASSHLKKDDYSGSILSRVKGLSKQNIGRENKENKQEGYVENNPRNINDHSSIYSKFSTKDNTYSTFENYSIPKYIDSTSKYSNSVLEDKSIFPNERKKSQAPCYDNKKSLNENVDDNIIKPMTRSIVLEPSGGSVYNRNKYGISNALDYTRKDYNLTSSKENFLTSKDISESKIGLNNLGNTCYMNTSLQCLIHCEPFVKKFLNEKEKYFGITSVRPTPISRAFYDLCVSIFDKFVSSKGSISPYDFKRIIIQSHNNFGGYQQHDTQEFCRLLLEDISGEVNRIINTPKYSELITTSKNKQNLNSDFDKLFRSREDSIVIDTFYGQMENIFKCMECNYETYSFEKFFDIPLLPESDNYSEFLLTDLLNQYFKSENFNWDIPCDNKRCKKKTIHEKSSKLSFLPEVLVLTIQRYNYRQNTKNNSKVKIQETLDMSDYVDRQIIGHSKSRYNLFAVNNHSGSLEFGHYYAYIRLQDGWFEFNDSYVSKICNMNYESNVAYVLFYKREGI